MSNNIKKHEYELYTLYIDEETGDGYIDIEFDQPLVLESR